MKPILYEAKKKKTFYISPALHFPFVQNPHYDIYLVNGKLKQQVLVSAAFLVSIRRLFLLHIIESFAIILTQIASVVPLNYVSYIFSYMCVLQFSFVSIFFAAIQFYLTIRA